MDAMGRLAAIGTGGVGGEHCRHQDETGRIDDQGLKRDTVIGRQSMRTEIIERDHGCSP
jgi:hypothetical protein